MSKKTKVAVTIISVICAVFIFFSAAVVYAWFTNRPRVYTSDQDTGNIARIGMRINLLFERLRPEGFTEGSTITYADGVTATYDPDAEWGTKDNPYIISMSRHMINLYALQRVGYFDDRYISKNFDDNGDYIENSAVMPYFLICDPEDASPIIVDGKRNGENIEIQPIGNDEYPFIGCIGGAQQNNTSDPATAPDGKTSISSGIANFDVVAKPGDVDVGLFGKIGYLGEEGEEGTDFNGAISYVNDLLLYDIRVISKNTGIIGQIADHLFANGFAGSIIRYEEDHHVGILAGHIEYASITNISVYYSDDGIKAIDVDDSVDGSGANYLSDSGFIGLVYNLNPVVSGNSIGSSSGTIIAGSALGAGNEWGGSIDMKTLFNRLRKTEAAITSYVISRTDNETTHYLCIDENGGIYDSTSESDAARWSGNSGRISTTVGGTVYYLSNSGNTTLTTTTDEGAATSWTKGNNNNYLYITSGTGWNSTTYYVSYNSNQGTNGWYLVNSYNYRATTSEREFPQTYASAETVIIDEVEGTKTVTTTSTSSYGSDVAYYYSEDGGSFVFAEPDETNYALFYGKSLDFFPVTRTTITKTATIEDGFVINSGSNYLNATYTTSASVVNITTGYDDATVWQLDNSGHLFTYLDKNPNNALSSGDNDIVKYYLTASNTGVLSLSTAGSTVFTKTENESHEGTLTYQSDGETWYIRYNAGWQGYPFANTFSVANGSNYLGQSNSTNVVGTSANHAQWNLESGKMMTYFNNTIYYLNASNTGELSVTTTATTTDWAEEGGVFSCTVNNNRWYLRWNGTTWDMFPSATSYTISSGTDYFGVTNNDLSLTNTAGAVRWVIDGNKLYTPINGTYYYLVGSTDGSGDLSLTTTRANGTDWSYTVNGGTMSYTGAGQTWYIYDTGSSWIVYPAASVTLISQNGQYLHASSNTAVDGETQANASAWLTDSSGHIYTFLNSAPRYLTSNGSSVYLNNSASTVWTHNVNGTLTDGNGWYLVYDGGWKALPSLSYIKIHSGDVYLLRNGNSVTSGTADNASLWFADGSKLYTVDGTQNYYLRAANNSISVVNSSASGTEFSYDGTDETLSFESGNTTYYLIYNNGWIVSTTTIQSGPISSGGSYLNASTTAISRGTAANSATNWVFDQTSGKIYTTINNTEYYLQGVLESIQTRSTTNLSVTTDGTATGTTWNYNNNNLSCYLTIDGIPTSYYLVLDNYNNTYTWKLINTNNTYYTINPSSRNTNYYLSFTSSNTVNNNVNNASNATLWTSSVTLASSAATPVISTIINNSTYYLNIPTTGNQVALTLVNSPVTLNYYHNASGGNAANKCFYRTQGSTEYFINYTSQGWVAYSGYDNYAFMTITTVSFTPATITISGNKFSTEKTNITASANNAFSSVAASNNVTFTTQNTGFNQTVTTQSENATDVFTPKQYQVTTKKVTTEAGGNDTYFPLVADDTAPFAANEKNTGYIVGGSHASYQQESGDVRFSSYYKFNNYLTSNQYFLQRSVNGSSYTSTYDATTKKYSSNLEVLTCTYLSEGFTRIEDSYNSSNTSVNTDLSSTYSTRKRVADIGLVKYDNARTQLDEMFVGSGDSRASYYDGSIYGVHFMDATISMENTIVAPKVVINEKTYYDYEMPEDCIDFRLRTKGYINFFAGTYYVNSGYENNCFFSLNQIFRVGNTITEIKRISKIYGDPNNDKATYIYQYGDGSWSQGSGVPASPYVEMFDTDWIERPTGFVERAMYYFEIPVNAGEYALGSVEKQGSENARYGAYLMYLDIGTSAANHASQIGTIDFVYDNLSDRIVVVPDTDENDSTVNHYVPSLVVAYTVNNDEDYTVKIDNFTMEVRRTIESTTDTKASTTVTFDGDDRTHLDAVLQANAGDELNVIGNTAGESP